MPIILKTIPALIFWGVFIFVIFQVPYPKSLTQASLFQTLSFFIPLFLVLTFTINIFFKIFLSSATISLGLILLLILKAVDALNFVTAGLTLFAIYLFLSYFQKSRKKRLTSSFKIPKLSSLRRKS